MTTVLSTMFDVALAVAVLSAAVLALFWPRRFTSVVMFLVFGVLLATAWSRLEAPDVGLAEAVLGAGMTGALLLSVMADGAQPKRSSARSRLWLPVLGGLFAVLLLFFLVVAVQSFSGDENSGDKNGGRKSGGLSEPVDANLNASGVENPVTAVLLNFRSYDTLLEVAVLVVAVLAALSLLPASDLTHLPTFTATPEPLDRVARVLAPLLLLLTGWFLVAGSTRPGGAFQAGALLAGALTLLRLAGWRTPPAGGWLRLCLLIGLAAFVLLAFGTAVTGQTWLQLDPQWADVAIVAVEGTLTVSIGATLAAIFVTNQSTAVQLSQMSTE